MKTVIRGIGLLVVVALIWVLVAVNRGTDVAATCGPSVTTPQMVTGLDRVGQLGDAVKHLVEVGKGDYDEGTIRRQVEFGIAWVKFVHALRDTFSQHATGGKEGEFATGIRKETAEKQAAALASCCPAAPVDPAPPEQGEPPNDGGDPGTPPFDPRTLSVSLGSVTQEEGEAQTAAIAATAVSVGKTMGIPRQGWVVIMATGMQESGGGKPWLLNLNHGDRDSVGWLQQRTSQGWGTVSQLMQPAFAAKQFYKALVKIDGWEQMPVTVAAQRVQISAFPNAYAKWEQPARDLVARVEGVGPTQLDPESTTAPAYCNPTTAEQNTDDTGTPGASLAAFTTAVGRARLVNPRTPAQALAWLAKQNQNTSSACLHYVAASYGYDTTQPAPAPADGSSIYGADEQWKLIPGKYKHPGDKNAPIGAVLYWGPTGTAGNPDGHTALMAPKGLIRSTGVTRGGGVGDKPWSYFKGYGEYLGWTMPYYPNRTQIGASA